MGLLRYIAIRVLAIIPTVLILYTVVFILLRILPGNPITAALGTKSIPPEELKRLEAELGLNKPLWEQYIDYLINVLHGDFGKSMVIRGRSITQDLMERLPATVELAIWSTAISFIIGLVTGTVAAKLKGTIIDNILRTYGILTYVLFIPWFGLLMQLIFSVWLGWLPTSGRLDPGIQLKTITGLYVLDALITGNWKALENAVAHLILPSLTLGIVLSGAYTRLVRNSLSQILSSKFIFAYRARGVRERKVLKHAIRNALIPVITYLGLQFALLLGGAVLTETTFSWPGLGQYLVEKVQYRDYPAVQAVIIVFAFLVGIISVIVDILYALLDPRIRY